MNHIGLVAIGRNEGERLHQCLRAALGYVDSIVYVDSGSTDDSVEFARSLGIEVVELNLVTAFTAARARNAGVERLLKVAPQIEFVQFVDGDCELVSGWLAYAQQFLLADSEVAVVCGRRRERYPNRSVYHQLCDMEWNTPIGETKACGGDAMMRVTAFHQVQGFNPMLIAGEEPELCVRLRQAGWKIWRLDAEMTLHDIQMTRFSQWWRRAMRAGHAYAEGSWLHGKRPECHWRRESLSIWCWGLLLPLLAFGLVWLTQGLSLWLLMAYPLLLSRIFLRLRSQSIAPQRAAVYAVFCLLAKLPMLAGMLKFWWHRLLGQRSCLVEYKGPIPQAQSKI